MGKGFCIIVFAVLLLSGCSKAPVYSISELQLDPANPVGGKAVMVTCVVTASSGPVPTNGGTSWHVSHGLLYDESQIQDGAPMQNVLGRSSISDGERVIYWIPPRERDSATLTVQYRGSEPFKRDISITAPPDSD